jgi:hypothetical protein
VFWRAVAIAPVRAADADLPLFGIPDLNLKALFGGGNSAPQPPPPPNLAPPPPPIELAGPPPPVELGAPSPLAGAYVPVPPPGMVTYPGYTAGLSQHGLPRRLLGTQTDFQR